MEGLNATIRDIPIPARLAHRPVSERGFPVPWFVSHINGKWDFVNLDPRKIEEAYRRKICFLCGHSLGKYAAFVIGPMCTVNRVSVEPPAHLTCAEYAVRVCPFLVRPNARRNEAAALGNAEDVPGIMLQHNPGAMAIWITTRFRPISDGHGGAVFQLGDPVEVHWYAEGRRASRDEITAAIDKGLPFLRRLAGQEGADAVKELDAAIGRAWHLMPT